MPGLCVYKIWLFLVQSNSSYCPEIKSDDRLTDSIVTQGDYCHRVPMHCTVCNSVWKINSHSGATYMLFLHTYTWRHHASEKVTFLAHFWCFLPTLLHIKNFFQKSKCVYHPRTRCHLCAKSDILTPAQSIYCLNKKVTHPDTQLISPSMKLSAPR